MAESLDNYTIRLTPEIVIRIDAHKERLQERTRGLVVPRSAAARSAMDTGLLVEELGLSDQVKTLIKKAQAKK